VNTQKNKTEKKNNKQKTQLPLFNQGPLSSRHTWEHYVSFMF